MLSFGLLGVAGLQAAALKYSRDAGNQAVAVNLAREMAEMIRSNARESGKTADNPYLMDVQAITVAPDEDPPSTCLDAGEVCAASGTQTAAAALAEAQVADWAYRVGKALPGAYATICLDEQPYDATGTYEGAPHWNCTNSGSIIAIKIGWEREDTGGVIRGATDDGVRPYVVLPVTPAGQQ